MRIRRTTAFRMLLAAFLAIGALLVGETGSIESGIHVSTAAAIRGRPLTPLSYAGVARRTTRRAVAAGAAAANVGRCVQVVDAYGRVITRCY